jgi:hypothetical protein
VEDCEVVTVVYRMDTAIRVVEGTQLQDLTKAKAAKVKRLRWAVLMEERQPQHRDTTVDARFWIVLQAVSMSPTAIEVTCFSPIEYFTRRVSASRQEVLTSSHTLPTSEGSQGYSRLARTDMSRTGSECSTA